MEHGRANHQFAVYGIIRWSFKFRVGIPVFSTGRCMCLLNELPLDVIGIHLAVKGWPGDAKMFGNLG